MWFFYRFVLPNGIVVKAELTKSGETISKACALHRRIARPKGAILNTNMGRPPKAALNPHKER
ncbi:hypothetical protein GCM10022404_00230 [Celeribacter arenosi]|uniref:Uncharacterized protein n=1 Tax=Celeribacter arenosi TaxID=792649 RepID=A0ABP7JSU8_9RHOB